MSVSPIFTALVPVPVNAAVGTSRMYLWGEMYVQIRIQGQPKNPADTLDKAAALLSRLLYNPQYSVPNDSIAEHIRTNSQVRETLFASLSMPASLLVVTANCNRRIESFQLKRAGDVIVDLTKQEEVRSSASVFVADDRAVNGALNPLDGRRLIATEEVQNSPHRVALIQVIRGLSLSVPVLSTSQAQRILEILEVVIPEDSQVDHGLIIDILSRLGRLRGTASQRREFLHLCQKTHDIFISIFESRSSYSPLPRYLEASLNRLRGILTEVECSDPKFLSKLDQLSDFIGSLRKDR